MDTFYIPDLTYRDLILIQSDNLDIHVLCIMHYVNNVSTVMLTCDNRICIYC